MNMKLSYLNRDVLYQVDAKEQNVTSLQLNEDKLSNLFPFSRTFRLRWLETVSSTYILMGRYNHSLTLDTTIMVSKNCPTIGERVIIFVTQ